MKSKLLKTIIITLVAVFGLSFVYPIQTAYADSDICNNTKIADEVKKAAGCSGNSDAVKDVILKILQAVIAITGLVAVVFIVIGGINYMTSTGDPGKIEKAKKTILYALIGLVICALAFAIVNWAIGVVNGSSKVGKATDYSSKETCEKAGHTWGKADDKATKETCH